MREVYRKNKTQFQTNDKTFAFMFIYTGKEIASYTELEKAMLKLIAKFNGFNTSIRRKRMDTPYKKNNNFFY